MMTIIRITCGHINEQLPKDMIGEESMKQLEPGAVGPCEEAAYD